MKISRIQQVTLAEMNGADYDAVVCASGFESRASYVASQLDVAAPRARSRIVLGFQDRQTIARTENDAKFKSLGFSSWQRDGSDVRALADAVGDSVRDTSLETVNVLVDISSMTRAWYAGLLRSIRRNALGRASVSVTFAYVPGKFVSPPDPPSPLTRIEFIPGFGDVDDPRRPTALVLGLGYERGRASAVCDFQDPDVAYLWLTSSSNDARFNDAAQANNADLIARVGPEHVVYYPLASLERTALRLESMCVGLLQTHRVAIAPLGPKPFSLLSLLVAYAVPRVAVWRATTGVSGLPIDTIADGEPMGLRVSFAPSPGAQRAARTS